MMVESRPDSGNLFESSRTETLSAMPSRAEAAMLTMRLRRTLRDLAVIEAELAAVETTADTRKPLAELRARLGRMLTERRAIQLRELAAARDESFATIEAARRSASADDPAPSVAAPSSTAAPAPSPVIEPDVALKPVVEATPAPAAAAVGEPRPQPYPRRCRRRRAGAAADRAIRRRLLRPWRCPPPGRPSVRRRRRSTTRRRRRPCPRTSPCPPTFPHQRRRMSRRGRPARRHPTMRRQRSPLRHPTCQPPQPIGRQRSVTRR